MWIRKFIDLQRLRTEKIRKRFLSKIIKIDSGCWIWNSAIGTSKYGVFSCFGTMYSAHVISYLLFIGDIENGLEVKHKDCHNRLCVCPDHLSQGTHASNIMEMSISGRAKSPISNQEVILIRSSSETGFELARRFKTTPRTIYNIRQRKTRKYI